jgi:hypothetical protein
MKQFKLIDTWISVVLIVSFALLSLIKLDYTFLIGYCVVGGWQLVSMLVHSIKGWFTRQRAGRYYYHLTVAVLIILTLVGIFIAPVLWAVMVVLLFAAPFMAAWYTWLCYIEVYVKMQRPMAALR